MDSELQFDVTDIQARELKNILADLPAEKVQALMDFAHYERYASQPHRSSADAILEGLVRCNLKKERWIYSWKKLKQYTNGMFGLKANKQRIGRKECPSPKWYEK